MTSASAIDAFAKHHCVDPAKLRHLFSSSTRRLLPSDFSHRNNFLSRLSWVEDFFTKCRETHSATSDERFWPPGPRTVQSSDEVQRSQR